MTKQVEAVYEQGRLRPLEPLELPEGTRLRITFVSFTMKADTRKVQEVLAEIATRVDEIQVETPSGENPADVLAEIAALPLEGTSGSFSGRDHDAVLYPRE